MLEGAYNWIDAKQKQNTILRPAELSFMCSVLMKFDSNNANLCTYICNDYILLFCSHWKRRENANVRWKYGI